MSTTLQTTLPEERITNRSKKIGIMLFNMGGPDDQESVKPFLFNLFSDPDIIKLPLSFLFQKILAWVIVTARGEEAKGNYALMGGGSPQLKITKQQAEALKTDLQNNGLDVPIYIAMRYWHPFTEEALEQVINDGIEHLVFVSLYPHFSYTTNGSSINKLKKVLKQKKLDNKITLSIIPAYYKDPDYLQALANCISTGLTENSWPVEEKDVHILFSAHSLPVKHVEQTKDPYPQHIMYCCEKIMNQFFPNNTWDLAFQSKVGKMPWLEPGTDIILKKYAAEKKDNILVVPLSFVSDHVETLVEIDQQYIPDIKKEGITNIYRAPVMNTRADYINLLSKLILEKINR